MDATPMMNVLPIEGLVPLNGDDVADIITVLVRGDPGLEETVQSRTQWMEPGGGSGACLSPFRDWLGRRV